MIDVEKMQKVNRLAQELLSHGMATDMEDAFRQADGLINKQQGTIDMPSRSSGQQYVQQVQAPPQNDEGNWFLAMQRLTKQLEQQARHIDELKATVSSLQSDLLTVKSMQNMRMMQAAQPASPPVAAAPAAPSVQMEQPHVEQQAPAVRQGYSRPQPAPRGSGNPRSGAFTPDDVSIEKFFYAGPGGAKIPSR